MIKEDIDAVKNLKGIDSVLHVVSQFSGPVIPGHMDCIFTWCYSEMTYFNLGRSDSLKQLPWNPKQKEDFFNRLNSEIKSKIQKGLNKHRIEN